MREQNDFNMGYDQNRNRW